MTLKNTTQSYGVVAQVLHAGMALLFVAAFATVYGRRWFTAPESVQNLAALQLHLSVGLSVLALALLRVWWRRHNEVHPDPLPGSPVEHAAARVVHGLLYGLMIIMPLTGYLGTGVAVDVFGLATVPRFADTAVFDLLVARGLGLDFETFEKPVDWLHKTAGEIAVVVLVGVHVGAAAFHHFVRRDGVLARMFVLPGGAA